MLGNGPMNDAEIADYEQSDARLWSVMDNLQGRISGLAEELNSVQNALREVVEVLNKRAFPDA
jgi:hypothetical protein